MKGSSEYQAYRDRRGGNRSRPPARTSRQLVMAGFEENREPTPPRSTLREARSRRGASPRARRRPTAPIARPIRQGEPGLLSAVEKMNLLIERAHLLRPRERAWVERIESSTKTAESERYLSDRQSEVITDIFDRFRTRLGR